MLISIASIIAFIGVIVAILGVFGIMFYIDKEIKRFWLQRKKFYPLSHKQWKIKNLISKWY